MCSTEYITFECTLDKHQNCKFYFPVNWQCYGDSGQELQKAQKKWTGELIREFATAHNPVRGGEGVRRVGHLWLPQGSTVGAVDERLARAVKPSSRALFPYTPALLFANISSARGTPLKTQGVRHAGTRLRCKDDGECDTLCYPRTATLLPIRPLSDEASRPRTPGLRPAFP